MKKKAFTLTELLVVVVIIGVLSAVVLPKFTKILQTRKTTEAENVMAAVRNEQEARCMVGRDYTADTTKLASLPKANSKNYTYSLDKQGITATAKDGEYVLQIPSYTDGRICCSGAGCDGLNKDYPKCGEIPNLETATCEAPDVPENQDPDPEIACNLSDYEHTCQEEGYSEEYTGSVTYTVNADCTGHTKTDTCTKPICEHPTNPDAAEDCEQTGGTWNAGDCTCDCPEGTHDDGSATCVADRTYCEYGKPGWDKWSETAQRCEEGQDAQGTWNTDICKCDCPGDSIWDEKGDGECHTYCEPGKPGWDKWLNTAQFCEILQDPDAIAGRWNTQTCKCDCPSGYDLNPDQQGGGCVPYCERTDENLGKALACEQPHPGNVEGTWNWDGPHACDCDCPNGSRLNIYGECEPIDECADSYWDQDREACTQGLPLQHSGKGEGVPGVFGRFQGDSDCMCHCSARLGAKLDYATRTCYRPTCEYKVATEAKRECLLEPRVGAFGASFPYKSCANQTYTGTNGKCYMVGGTGPYVKGQYNSEKCWCTCPKGSSLKNGRCTRYNAGDFDPNDFGDGEDIDYENYDPRDFDYDFNSYDEDEDGGYGEWDPGYD